MSAFKKLVPWIKPYWGQIVLGFITLTAVSIAELFIPLQIQRIIDDGIAAGNSQVILVSTLIMVGLSIVSMVAMFGNAYYSVVVSEYFGADIRELIYRQIQNFSFANLDKLQTGELLVRLTSDVNALKTAIVMVMRMFFRAPLMLIGALIILIITSPTLSLLLVVLLPATAFLIIWYSRRTEPLYKKVQERLDRVNTILQENIAGVRVVKAFVRADREEERFGDANNAYTEKNIEVNLIVAVLFPTMMTLLNLGTAAILWFGGNLSVNGLLTTGEIVAFVNYLGMTVFPILMLAMILPQIYAAQASADRILEVVEAEPTINDESQAVNYSDKKLSGHIAFENVWFAYNNGECEDEVLKGISFKAEPGETVAILGATGSGKSSLINLIPRLYDVTDGRVLIDGVDVRHLPQETLRQQVGYALQEAVLFSGTIRDNIKYGRPEATDEEVIAAAKAAQAYEFIMSKEGGLDAHVEQRGKNFSGGQKQRLAIARALCVKPAVLILDDSTSAVDIETETEIQAALEDMMAQTTTIVVAQRISTVLNADKILVLYRGQIAAEGRHEELLESSPIYREIYDSQLGDGLLKNNEEVTHAHA